MDSNFVFVDDRQFRSFLSAEDIRETIKSIANQINADYEINDKVVLVGVLKGAFMVMADLVRELHSDVRVDFVRTKNYGKSLTTTGTVTLLKDISMDLRDKHVIIVEEIIDSGRALKFLHDRLLAAGPLSLKIATLLDKRSRRLVDVKVDYVGKIVDEQFLIGYGLDLEETYRNLPGIHALRYPN